MNDMHLCRMGPLSFGLFPWGFSPKGLFTFCAQQKQNFLYLGQRFKIPLSEGH